jgi:hypothetical protein
MSSKPSIETINVTIEKAVELLADIFIALIDHKQRQNLNTKIKPNDETTNRASE